MSALKTPARVYLESTAVVPLGAKFESVDIEKLLALRQSAPFKVYVSEVSWLEYIRKRKNDLSFLLDSLAKADRVLDRHGMPIAEIGEALAKVKEYLANIDAHYRAKASRKEIEIVPLTHVDTAQLLRMSIDCVPPFEEADNESKEKGFRDSLIMFSILHSLRDTAEPALVVTQDQLLADAFKLSASESEAQVIVVKTIDEATAYITDTIAESERLRLREESIKAVQLLSRYRDDISQKIGQIRELTDRDFGQGLRWDQISETDRKGIDIRRIRSIEFEKIDSALWKDQETSASRVLFRCLCKATVLVPAPKTVAQAAEPRRFKIGEPPSTTGTIWSGTLLPYNESLEERQLPFDVYGVAELTRAADGGEWQLTAISLEKSVPGEDEFHALATAEIND